jgi:hypothetical protein
MTELLSIIGKLILGFAGILGPVAFLLALRSAHDRRVAALSARVLQELNSPDLRGLFAAKVKSPLTGADTVVVDLWSCSRDQVWEVMERLSAKLPAHVRVEVNGVSDCRMRSVWTLSATGKFSPATLCP